MRIVSIHVDFMRYKAVKKTKFAEELENREGCLTGGVVLMTCVEKNDEGDPALIVESATAQILKKLDQIKCSKVMIYPYAHLSSGIASPEVSLQILKELEKSLLECSLEVTRAAFGWYKEFEMKSKGHPLADLSMTICPYIKRDCDCQCPYCKSPLKKEELK